MRRLPLGRGVARTSICCIARKVHVREIQEPPEPLHSLIRWAHGDSAEFRAEIREYNALVAFASVGGDLNPKYPGGLCDMCTESAVPFTG